MIRNNLNKLKTEGIDFKHDVWTSDLNDTEKEEFLIERMNYLVESYDKSSDKINKVNKKLNKTKINIHKSILPS